MDKSARTLSEPASRRSEIHSTVSAGRRRSVQVWRKVLAATCSRLNANSSHDRSARDSFDPSRTGVNSSEAYPALLETLLKAKGIDAHVANAGIPSDSTGGMHARLSSAVADGAQLVIIEAPLQHETGDTDANVAMIVSALKARGIKVVMLDKRGIRSSPDLFDGGHPNARGQAVMAARALPKVIAAVGLK